MTKPATLQLCNLTNGMPGITRAEGAYLLENAMVAFHRAGHKSPTQLGLSGIANTGVAITWSDGSVGKQMMATYNDEQENVEFAAMGISALLTPHLTDYTVIMRSKKGTGVDYWLGKQDCTAIIEAGLEVSGIASETENNTIAKRVAAKRSQIKASDILKIPLYISVVEMATPKAHYEHANTISDGN